MTALGGGVLLAADRVVGVFGITPKFIAAYACPARLTA
jgi:hypothetical protein